MALDFGDWVVAFLSLDNMFKVRVSHTYLDPFNITILKPIYAIDREDLPAQHIDVYFDFEKFVDSAVNWAHCALFSQKRADEATLDNRPTGFPNPPKPLATRDRLALHAIRKSDIFGGLGVYTATEVFFLAGAYKPVHVKVERLIHFPKVLRVILWSESFSMIPVDSPD